MPRFSDDAAAGFGLQCDGLYEHVVMHRCWADAMTGQFDPRCLLGGTSPDDLAAAAVGAERRFGGLVSARLAVGEPVTAALWEVAGDRYGLPRDMVPDDWRAGQEFTVYPDDTVVMAS